MPVTINGTTGISYPDGSAGAPTIRGQDADTGIFFPAADTLAFVEGGTEVLRINSAGNIGIGTTIPQATFGGRALQLGNTLDTRSVLTLQSTNTGLGSLYFSDGTSGGETYVGFIEYNHTTDRMDFGTLATARMFLTSTGNVGIGFTNPTGKLEIIGNIRVRTTTAGMSDQSIEFSESGSGNSYGVRIGHAANTSLAFERYDQGWSEMMRIVGNGNVGIGTNNPGNKLEVYGVDASSIVHYAGNSRGGIVALSNQRVVLSTTADADDILFGYGDSPVTSANFVSRMKIDNGTGNVGIGTLNPSSKLHVQGNLLVKSGDFTVDTGLVSVYSSGNKAPVIEQNGAIYFNMRGKLIQSNSNATATELLYLSGLYNAGAMIKVIVRGAHAISAIMYEDTLTAWVYYVGGTYQNSGIGPTTTQNIINTHNIGALSWANVSGGTPSLRYTQGNNGYILEALDIIVVCRDGCNVTWNRDHIVFG